MDCGLKHYINLEFPEFDNFTEITHLIQDMCRLLWNGSGKNSIYGEKERVIKQMCQNIKKTKTTKKLVGLHKGIWKYSVYSSSTYCKFVITSKFKTCKKKKKTYKKWKE